MKRGRTFTRARSRECSCAASAFMQPTAASIAIANKSAPTTSPTISSENGVIGAARRAITFSIGRCSSEKCEWARTSQTSVRAHPRPRNLRRPPQAAVLLQHRQDKERRPRVRLPKPQRKRVSRRHKQLRLLPRVRRELLPHHPRRLRQRYLRVLRQLALLLRPLLAQQPQVPPLHQARKLRARRGRSRPRVCRRCIPPRGIMCISTHRAASTPIQICQPTVSFTKNGGLLDNVPPPRCNFPVRMRRPKGGRLFPVTMQNVLW